MHPSAFIDAFVLARAFARSSVEAKSNMDEGILVELPKSPDIKATAKRVAAHLPKKARFIDDMPRRGFRQTPALQRAMWRAVAFEAANSSSVPADMSLPRVPTAVASFGSAVPSADTKHERDLSEGAEASSWSVDSSVRAEHELSLLEVLCPR